MLTSLLMTLALAPMLFGQRPTSSPCETNFDKFDEVLAKKRKNHFGNLIPSKFVGQIWARNFKNEWLCPKALAL